MTFATDTRRRLSAAVGSTLVSAALVLSGGLLSACSVDNSTLGEQGSSAAAPIVVGTGDSDESAVLSEIYAGVLRSTGVPVSVTPELGERADYLGALDSGAATVVPEFTGELLEYFDPAAVARTPTDVFEELSKSLPQGLAVSDFAAAEKRSVLVVDQGDARDVHDLGELAPRCAAATIAVGDEFDESSLESVPGCTFAAIHRVDDRAAAEELRSGTSTVAGLTTLSEVLGTGGLVALGDDDGVFRAQNVVPLYRSGTLTDAQIKALNVVAGELTSADLGDMVSEVRAGKKSAEVARTWLEAHA